MKAKQFAAAVVLGSALSGCATGPSGPTPAQVSAQHDAESALAACARQNAADVDDHMSDASTIAIALHTRCNREYTALVDAFAAPLAPMPALRFRQQAYGEHQEVETFLPAVIAERKGH